MDCRAVVKVTDKRTLFKLAEKYDFTVGEHGICHMSYDTPDRFVGIDTLLELWGAKYQRMFVLRYLSVDGEEANADTAEVFEIRCAKMDLDGKEYACSLDGFKEYLQDNKVELGVNETLEWDDEYQLNLRMDNWDKHARGIYLGCFTTTGILLHIKEDKRFVHNICLGFAYMWGRWVFTDSFGFDNEGLGMSIHE